MGFWYRCSSQPLDSLRSVLVDRSKIAKWARLEISKSKATAVPTPTSGSVGDHPKHWLSKKVGKIALFTLPTDLLRRGGPSARPSIRSIIPRKARAKRTDHDDPHHLLAPRRHVLRAGTFWRLGFCVFGVWLGCCDVEGRLDVRSPGPTRRGGCVWRRWAERSGAVPGGLAWLCVEERYPLVCWVRGKESMWVGVGILWASEQNGGTARTCCAGRSPSTERPLPCRLHMHMHERTRLHRRRPSLALVCSALSVGGDGDEQKQSALGALGGKSGGR